MKFLKLISARRYRSLLLLFMGVIGLLAVATVEGSLAQSTQNSNGVFLPIVVGELEQSREQVHDHSTHTHEHIGHISADGRFTGTDGSNISWPPQVKNIEEVVWDNNIEPAIDTQLSAAFSIATTAYANQEVRSLLGERFSFISANPLQKKWSNNIIGHEVVYFSYSNNITIEAVILNGKVDNIRTFAASEYQPPLRNNEVEDAIAIARTYWQEQGNRRVDALQGFTIQTFKTDGDGGYYDTRMSYVSFHIDETSAPELLTWVDLTNQTVVRAAIDQGGEIDVQ